MRRIVEIVMTLFTCFLAGHLSAQEKRWVHSFGYDLHTMTGDLAFPNTKLGHDGLYLNDKLHSTSGGLVWNVRRRDKALSLTIGATLFFEGAKWGYHDIFYGAAFTVDSGY